MNWVEKSKKEVIPLTKERDTNYFTLFSQETVTSYVGKKGLFFLRNAVKCGDLEMVEQNIARIQKEFNFWYKQYKLSKAYQKASGKVRYEQIYTFQQTTSEDTSWNTMSIDTEPGSVYFGQFRLFTPYEVPIVKLDAWALNTHRFLRHAVIICKKHIMNRNVK
jgi:hypothetical protein